MDKKEIYEHLAKIYLDASYKSSKKKKKSKGYPGVFKNLFFVSIVFALSLAAALFFNLHKKNPFGSETALVLLNDAAKINFHFNPAKKETFALDLNHLDAARYNTLGFAVKTANFQDDICLKVEFTNAFNEKSEVYFKGIPNKWHDFKIRLSEFKKIRDWTDLSGLSFVVEEWNTKEKKGVVYVDNVRLLR